MGRVVRETVRDAASVTHAASLTQFAALVRNTTVDHRHIGKQIRQSVRHMEAREWDAATRAINAVRHDPARMLDRLVGLSLPPYFVPAGDSLIQAVGLLGAAVTTMEAAAHERSIAKVRTALVLYRGVTVLLKEGATLSAPDDRAQG